MTTGFQITCANKSPAGTIVRVGGPGWSLAVHDAIVKIVTQQLRFYIAVGDTDYDIGVRGDGMAAYLVLEPEGKALHEVHGLLSC